MTKKKGLELIEITPAEDDPDEPYTTTPEDFELFKQEVRTACKRLNIYDWEIGFSHCELDNSNATCESVAANHIATMSLNTELVDGRSNDLEAKIIKLSRHETIHILIASLMALALRRTATAEEISQEVERTVRHLYGIIYGHEELFEK